MKTRLVVRPRESFRAARAYLYLLTLFTIPALYAALSSFAGADPIGVEPFGLAVLGLFLFMLLLGTAWRPLSEQVLRYRAFVGPKTTRERVVQWAMVAIAASPLAYVIFVLGQGDRAESFRTLALPISVYCGVASLVMLFYYDWRALARS